MKEENEMACMCGDALCSSCNPGAAEAMAAEEAATERMGEAHLLPEEYDLCVTVGLCAVVEVRKSVEETIRIRAQLDEEAKLASEAP